MGIFMKKEKNILIAFLLNLLFAIFEFLGGIFTGSVAILSDALHDIGDALSIGFSFFLEKKSKRPPDHIYTYGYLRYSVMGGIITTLILIIGSVTVIYNAVMRILNPAEIHYNGMIIFAIVGVLVNLFAVYFTKNGNSVNEKAVYLHMLEDALGWITVLIGALVMKFTDISIIDPLMSIGVATFILITSIKNLKKIIDILLEKIPDGYSVEDIKNHIMEIDGIIDVHHIHLWTADGQNIFATMHIKTNSDFSIIKNKVRKELTHHGINHSTLELERENEVCQSVNCSILPQKVKCCHSHSHNHF